MSFGIKAGIFPFHIWLPIAHPTAPSPASAILSGIMIKTGAFSMMRIMYNMYDINMIREVNWHIYLLIIAGITIILGSLGAVFEYDIKRRLAYSSIGQIGYIMLGMALLNLVYYSPIIISAFFKESVSDKIKDYRDEASWRMLVPIFVLALSTIIFDIIPANIPLEMARKATKLLFN